ncbi:family 2B encapsulin nanocompartment shell protein [Asaia prunellae]|uniref:family 2B encapsulin nanocompartment shell protein n=1 Tax=Asaia prunellae TaxID=610245 RepID=UPI00047229D7|nr:family 2A encapsulin nanocompartment shell protein [Asaia prunellae]
MVERKSTLAGGPTALDSNLAARQLATAHVTSIQNREVTPRWLHKLLPWVSVGGGVYRVNRRRILAPDSVQVSNTYGEAEIALLSSVDGEPKLPTTFVDYDPDPREYYLHSVQTVLRTHTRVTDLYSNEFDQLREQVRVVIDVIKEREEWELINNSDFGFLSEAAPAQRIETRNGRPTPDDLDELLQKVWKRPGFFLAHPKAISAFAREATRRGVPPPTITLFGSPFITWRGVPLVPSDKLPVSASGQTSILLLRVGENEQGVVGLQKTGIAGEVEPGLSVRYSGTDQHAVASHLVTRYFSAAVLVEDAIARLDNVLIDQYYDYS